MRVVFPAPEAPTIDTNSPPSIFAPLPLPPAQDEVFVMGDGPDTASVDPTEITILSEDDIGLATAIIIAELIKDPNVQWVAITAGGIVVGYATAGASVYVQALAAGSYAATTNYVTSEGKSNQNSSTLYSGAKDTAIGLTPLPPVVQAAISITVDKTVEVLSQAPGLNNSSTRPGGWVNTFSK